jgi:hypothetical protein
MTTDTTETAAVLDTILIFECQPSIVGHRYCSAEEANRVLDEGLKTGSGGAAITITSGLTAEEAYDIFHQIRKRVADAKDQLRDDIYLRDILNKHNVPDDVEIRKSVYAVIKEIRGH